MCDPLKTTDLCEGCGRTFYFVALSNGLCPIRVAEVQRNNQVSQGGTMLKIAVTAASIEPTFHGYQTTFRITGVFVIEAWPGSGIYLVAVVTLTTTHNTHISPWGCKVTFVGETTREVDTFTVDPY